MVTCNVASGWGFVLASWRRPEVRLFASIPTTLADLHILCTAASCTTSGQLTPDNVRELHTWGLSMDFYATYIVVFIMVFAFGYFAVGAVLFWRLFTSPERPLC